MKQVIDDIHFHVEDLEEVKMSSLKFDWFSLNHLFLQTKSKKLILLLKAGNIIDENFVKKYSGSKLLSLSVNSDHYLSELVRLLKKQKQSKNEKERRLLAEESLEHMLRIFSSYDESFLGLGVVLFEHLYRLPRKFLLEQYHHSSILNQRSLIIASFTVIIALSDGVTDFDYLRDLFTAAFHLDSGLYIEQQMCHHLIQASEQERLDGNGRELLSSIQEEKLDIFINHPVSSFNFLQGHSHFFKNKKVIEFVKYHHENTDGTGFPQGTIHEALSDKEEYISIADNIVSFDIGSFIPGDCTEFKFELAEFVKNNQSYCVMNLHLLISEQSRRVA